MNNTNTPDIEPVQSAGTVNPAVDSLPEGQGGQRGASAPRLVLRGANQQTRQIDWLRLVIPQQHAGEVSSKFDDLFGQHEASPGRFGLRNGRSWVGGAHLAIDGPKEGMSIAPHAVVELPGGFLAPMTHDDRLGLLTFLLMIEGAHCTRIDLAIDFHGKDIPLIGELIDACQRRELTGAKRFEPDVAYRYEWGEPRIVKEQLCIGARGKNGSGRYVRCYDKGLERKTQPRGEWIRWEAEFSKGVAQAVAVAICQADDPMHVVEEYAFGACDFRQANGKQLRDRPRCTWWQHLLNRITPQKATMPRRKPDVDRYAEWLRYAVLPGMDAYADALGLGRDDFIEVLVGEVQPNLKKLATPAGKQLLALYPRMRKNTHEQAA